MAIAYMKYATILLVAAVLLFAVTHMEALREFFAIDALPA